MFASAPQQFSSSSTGQRRRSILLIDDDHGQVTALSHRLAKHGFRVYGAGSARYGVEVALQQQPDLILLDLRLPDADGFEVCAQLTDHPDTCFIPVIILSGMERHDIVRSARAAGSQYFVRKPYDPSALLVLIEQAIAESLSC
jgi:CheY-like chemotaxis protein